MRRALLVIALLCAALPAPAVFASSATAGQADSIAGVVRYVIDGDTLLLQADGGGKPIKLRLLGLDAPEICQAGGREARDALAGRVVGRRVLATGAVRDDYQRRLVRLTLDGEDIGAWMVLQGHAWSARYRGRSGPYAQEEAAARAARRGLFADPDPQPPHSFRRSHGSCYPAPAP
ncbi:MAG TPA: thermonuclease family protein [Burkholderiaceae bacterium]|jgi:endonuclease YncB( thermonuclease family)|nr:thermonuclease family protein [Burkholderiaceae bacterium]